MELDLLERSRAGDRVAYRALVSFWGSPALRVAYLIAGDRARAEDAVREAFQDRWRELPSFHSERPFRPWLLGKVVEAARARVSPPADDDHVAIVLHASEGLSPAEIALTLGWGRRGARSRVKRIAGAAGGLRDAALGIELPSWFFDEVIAPGLKDSPLVEVRRIVRSGAADAAIALRDVAALRRWVAHDVRVAASRLDAGTRAGGTGRIADRLRSRDRTLFTRASAEMIAWTTRATPRLGTIEFRWSIEIARAGDAIELRHRLNGVAFPGGFAGARARRAYAKVADAMPASMHRGLERLANVVEGR